MYTAKLRICSLTIAGALALSGCTSTGPKQTQGALVGGAGGALAGGLIGNAVGGRDGALVGIALGGLAGALVGSEIGRHMDERDRALHDAAVRRAYAQQAKSRGTVRTTWHNPATGNSGEVYSLRAHGGNPNCVTFVDVLQNHGTSGTFKDESSHCAGSDGSY